MSMSMSMYKPSGESVDWRYYVPAGLAERTTVQQDEAFFRGHLGGGIIEYTPAKKTSRKIIERQATEK